MSAFKHLRAQLGAVMILIGPAFYAATPFPAEAQTIGSIRPSYTELDLVRDCGANLTDAVDDGPAITTCLAKVLAAGGGKIVIPSGVVTANALLNQPGVLLEGQCSGVSSTASSYGYPTGTYWKPSSNSAPALQVGNDDKIVHGISVSCIDFNGGGVGQYGVKVTGGAMDASFDNIRVQGFTVWDFGKIGGTNYLSAHTRLRNSTIRAYPAGSIAYYAYDPVSSGTVFMNDNFLSDTYIASGSNAQAFLIDSTWEGWSNVKIDTGNLGGVFRNTVITPHIYCGALCQIDNPGNGVGGLTLVYDGFGSFTQSPGFASVFSNGGQINGRSLASEAKPTITVTSGSPTATLSSVTGVAPGMTVAVQSVGGSYWYGAITAVNTGAAQVTLSANAPRSETAAPAYVGYAQVGIRGIGNASATLSGQGLGALYDATHCAYGYTSTQPMLFGAGNCGVAPYNSFNYVWEMGPKTLAVLTETKSGITPNAVSMTSNVINVQYSGLGAQVGDLMTIRGANEAGVSTSCIVSSITSNFNHFCPVPVGTFSDVAAATGTIKVFVAPALTFGAGTITYATGREPLQTTSFGTFRPTQHSGGTSNDLLNVADTANGVIISQYGGSLAGTSNAGAKWCRITTPFTCAMILNGGSGLALGTGSNPYGKPSLYLQDAAGESGNSVGTDGIIYVNGGVPKFKTGAVTAVPLTTRVAVPATATSTCTAGQVAADTSFHYDCVATDTWRRVAIATW